MLSEIVNHLWQSTLVAAAVAVLAALLRGYGAQTRYWLWWAASLKFLVPFSLLTLAGASLAESSPGLVGLVEWPAALGALAEPMAEPTRATPLTIALLGVWVLGSAVVAGTWVARAGRAHALVRESSPWALELPHAAAGLQVRGSRSLLEPALVGIARPVLLLPQSIAEHLSPPQLAAVLEHELAHWRRRDNLTAAVHMLVEAVFWFHPLVWWIGARLVEERERACDEAVVRAGHDGGAYAEGILNVCERYVASALKCAAGISGADLKRRVVELARNRVMRDLPMQQKALLGALALSTLLVPVVFGAAQPGAAPMPIVRINPIYPEEAIATGREGFVELEFTVAANGSIKDVVVIQSTSLEFEEPAVAAVLRWRYLPTNMTCVGTDCRTIENAVPLERPGVRAAIHYNLEGEQARIRIE